MEETGVLRDKHNKAPSSTCVQRANSLLNCLLSSSSMNECEKQYKRFQECCSKHNIVHIKLEGVDLGLAPADSELLGDNSHRKLA